MKESESVELKKSLAELKDGLNLRIRTTDKATDKKVSATTVQHKSGIIFGSVGGITGEVTGEVYRGSTETRDGTGWKNEAYGELEA